MSESLECRIGLKNDLQAVDLIAKDFIGKELWIAKVDRNDHRFEYKFFDRCHYNTFFVPKHLKIGDEIHIGAKKIKESKRRFVVKAKSDYSMVVSPV